MVYNVLIFREYQILHVCLDQVSKEWPFLESMMPPKCKESI